jgi:hypothetical protein
MQSCVKDRRISEMEKSSVILFMNIVEISKKIPPGYAGRDSLSKDKVQT